MRLAFLAFALVACAGSNTLAPPDAAQDVLGLEVAADVSATPGPDAPPPDVAAVVDAAADTGPDAAPSDATPDVAAVADAGPDAPQVDAAPDADPLEQHVTAVAVTVHAPGYDWTMPRTQMCTINGSSVSVGAEYDRPERATFTVSGPIAGPVVLTLAAGGTGTSDIRATIRSGARYYIGSSDQRVSLFVRGMIPGGLPYYELTALGCTVR